ncbi:MAG: hypothetical protein JWM44_3647 [Bacilli bacterium]|nr:hypothetical protein [Bacilli bacterium]
MNPRMSDPQTDALTTSPRPPQRYFTLAGAVGLEPTPKVLETFVLPLNYAPRVLVEDDGFEPPNSKRADLQSAVFSHFTNPPKY